MAVGNFIYFNDYCREAVEYYAEIFNTEKPQFMFCKDVPGIPDFVGTDRDRAEGRIMYTSLKIKGTTVMFADVLNDRIVEIGDNICLTVTCETIEETKTIFDKLKVGGLVQIELQEVFFTKCLGLLTDKFGVCWYIIYHPESN